MLYIYSHMHASAACVCYLDVLLLSAGMGRRRFMLVSSSHHRAANAAAARDDIFHGETDAPGTHSACLLPCIDLYVCMPFLFQ